MSLHSEAVRRANEALDDLRAEYVADVAARQSHSSEAQARVAGLMRAAGVDQATVEMAVHWACGDRRIATCASGVGF